MKKILFFIISLLLIGTAYAQCGIITTDTILEDDLIANGDCISIGANNIVLDGNGHTITGNGSGVAIMSAGTGVTIKNFRISGFKTSISLENSDSSIVEDNHISMQSNYSKGIHSLNSDSLTVRGNTIVMENAESAAIYITNSRDLALENNEVTCKSKIFFEKTACVYLKDIMDSEIMNNNIEYKEGKFFPTVSCLRVYTGQNNKYHDNAIKGYCSALVSSGEKNSEYYSNLVDIDGFYGGSIPSALVFASGENNIIRDSEVSAPGNIFNFNTGTEGTKPLGYIVKDIKIDGNLIFSASKLTEITVYGNRHPQVITPGFGNKTSLGKFNIQTFINTPGYVEFSIKYNPYLNVENIDEGTVRLYYYNSSAWQELPGTTVDRDTHTIHADYIAFPTTYSGNHLRLGVWADAALNETYPSLCQPDCTKGDNITYLECESNTGCQDVQMNFLDPSGTGIAIANCDKKTVGSNYYFLASYCIGDVLYENYTCRQNAGLSGTIVSVFPSGRACGNGCDNGTCIYEAQNETPPIEGICPGNKVLICHNTDISLCVANSSVSAHLDHGDSLGLCENNTETPAENQEQNTTNPNEESETEPPVPGQNTTAPHANETADEPPVNHGCPPSKILICHNGKNELCVASNAVPAHLKHGDYEGMCVNEKADSKELKNIKKDEKVSLEFNNSVKVSFRALKEKNESNILITARIRDVPPADVPLPKRKVSNYLVIDHPDIDNSELADSKIEFTVTQDYLTENNAYKEDVILGKFAGSWRDLKTNYVKTIENTLYFEADSLGFSTFAVTINNTVAPVQAQQAANRLSAETEETDGKEDSTDSFTNKLLYLPVIAGASLFVLLLFVLLVFPPKQKRPEKNNPDQDRYKPVLQYIEKRVKSGIKKEDIRKELEKAGYDNETIEKLMKLSFS